MAKRALKTRTKVAEKSKPLPKKKASAPKRTERVLDPRAALAIALALEEEAAADARARELAASPSAWTLAARARGVQTRWTQ